MNQGTKPRIKKENRFLEFTLLFANEKLYVGQESIPLGQITTEVLNCSDERLLALRRNSNNFLGFMNGQFYSPHTKKDLALATAAQAEFNKVLDIIYSLPLFNQLSINLEKAFSVLPRMCIDNYDAFERSTVPDTAEHQALRDYITKHVILADELQSFKTYVTSMLDIYFKHLKLRNAEHYAVGFYRFLSDTTAQQMIAQALPQTPFAVFQQARSAMIEYTTLPNPENVEQFMIGEQMVFHNYVAFLHVDLFRGLMSGNSPRRCHNCGQFFLLTDGYDTVYCNRVAPGETEKTCRKVGAHRKAAKAEGKTPARKMYDKVYNRLKQRHLRKNISRDEWNAAVALALEYKDKAERGELTDLQLQELYDKM